MPDAPTSQAPGDHVEHLRSFRVQPAVLKAGAAPSRAIRRFAGRPYYHRVLLQGVVDRGDAQASQVGGRRAALVNPGRGDDGVESAGRVLEHMAPFKTEPARDQRPHAGDSVLDLRLDVAQAHAAVH
eukprot:8767721-Pyramimonas_sp.AAC.1